MVCKHADKMMIYAKQAAECDEPWKLWQFKHLGYKEWSNCDAHPLWSPIFEYRQIPKTIKVGNFDVPEPMRDKPEYGDYYYIVDQSEEAGARRCKWSGDEFDERCFDRGIHRSQKDCTIHAKALFSFSEVR